MNDFWKVFLTSNETKYRLLRTISQGVIGVIIANVDMLVGLAPIAPELKPVIVAFVMAILSPLYSELGAKIATDADPSRIEYEEDHDEDEEGDEADEY